MADMVKMAKLALINLDDVPEGVSPLAVACIADCDVEGFASHVTDLALNEWDPDVWM